MVEYSKGFRTGQLVEVSPEGRLAMEGMSETPYIAIRLQSEIPIGFGEVVKEETKVLLLGGAVVEWWNTMLPAPKEGDTVRISFATMYVNNGVLCMRVQDPSAVEVIPQNIATSAPGLDTFKTINAKDFFRAVFAERKQQEN